MRPLSSFDRQSTTQNRLLLHTVLLIYIHIYIYLQAGKSKGGKKAPLGSSRNGGGGNNEGSGQTVEQRYQKKTQLEHILLRPDTYSESVKSSQSPAVFQLIVSPMLVRSRHEA